MKGFARVSSLHHTRIRYALPSTPTASTANWTGSHDGSKISLGSQSWDDLPIRLEIVSSVPIPVPPSDDPGPKADVRESGWERVPGNAEIVVPPPVIIESIEGEVVSTREDLKYPVRLRDHKGRFVSTKEDEGSRVEVGAKKGSKIVTGKESKVRAESRSRSGTSKVSTREDVDQRARTGKKKGVKTSKKPRGTGVRTKK